MISKLLLALCTLFCAAGKDEIPYRQYENWKEHKPGASVRLRMIRTQGPGKIDMLIDLKLLDVNNERAIVQMKTARLIYSRIIESDPKLLLLEAKRKEGEGEEESEVEEEEGEKKGQDSDDITPPEDVPAGCSKKKGEEEVRVGGKPVKCSWVELSNTANNYWSKMWTSEKMPGGLVRLKRKMGQKWEITVDALKWTDE